jgi:pilus assembly protein Flp/PilA
MIQRITSVISDRFPEREEGQGMVEYGLIIALVAVVAIAGLIIMGPKIAAMFTALGASV